MDFFFLFWIYHFFLDLSLYPDWTWLLPDAESSSSQAVMLQWLRFSKPLHALTRSAYLWVSSGVLPLWLIFRSGIFFLTFPLCQMLLLIPGFLVKTFQFPAELMGIWTELIIHITIITYNYIIITYLKCKWQYISQWCWKGTEMLKTWWLK